MSHIIVNGNKLCDGPTYRNRRTDYNIRLIRAD